MLLPQAPEKDC